MYHQNVSQETGDIFSKVNNEERLRLFKDLATIRGEIACKGESDEIYRLTVERTSGKVELQCSIPFGLAAPAQEKELLGNFFIGGERYFFKTPVRVEKDVVILRMDGELFHLQRRQNYRIKIPDSYQAHILITAHNKGKVKLKGQIYDLSSGGCRVVFHGADPAIESGDYIDGHIVIGRREPLEIESTVRHHKIEKSGNASKQIFGLEFKSLSTQVEGKLFAITMDLHREFFSRLNTKN
ncbi:flagellar brake protein [Bdellovibrio sp. HCB337]|uniref:flagellar brake protein n=1 Tax=Bdellovibrio sp. HCB337 TaxID=3394358 RepID=UPI0039A6EB56